MHTDGNKDQHELAGKEAEGRVRGGGKGGRRQGAEKAHLPLFKYVRCALRSQTKMLPATFPLTTRCECFHVPSVSVILFFSQQQAVTLQQTLRRHSSCHEKNLSHPCTTSVPTRQGFAVYLQGCPCLGMSLSATTPANAERNAYSLAMVSEPSNRSKHACHHLLDHRSRVHEMLA